MSGLAQSLVGSALLDTDLDTLFSKTISAQKPTLLGNKRKKSTTGPDNAKKPKKNDASSVAEEATKKKNRRKQDRKQAASEDAVKFERVDDVDAKGFVRKSTAPDTEEVETYTTEDSSDEMKMVETAGDDGESENETDEETAEDHSKKKSRRQIRNENKEKNTRTIFVGNLPLKVTEKAGIKELKSVFCKYGQIESIRFRSIARLDKMPRKAAYITKSFHPGRETLNAYVVYKDKESVEKALAEDGSLFMGLHIRVDKAGQSEKHDYKRSVFVGSLPFDIGEEKVRTFFSQCGDIEYVRLIRDKATNVGKGIGYVQFKDKAAVGLALKLSKSELEGRKIRVERCKDTEAKPKQASEGTRASRPTTRGAVGKVKTRVRSKATKAGSKPGGKKAAKVRKS